MRKIPRIYAIPVGIAVAAALLIVLGLSTSPENRIYDAFLGLRPSPMQDKNIVLIDVDDLAVSAVGTWPISRSITADALLLLKEMGSRYAVFDIEYVNKSPRGVNASVLDQTIPGLLTDNFSKLTENNAAFIQALRARRIPLSEAPSFVTQFQQSAESSRQDLVTSLKKIAIDNDQRLAQAATIFGGAVLTVRLLESVDPSVEPAIKKIAVTRFSIPLVKNLSLLPNHPDISPTIDPILSAAQSLGFTNVAIDTDGVRRRIDLVKRYENAAFPQLGFAPFLDLVGHPAIEIRGDAIVLTSAKYPDGKTYDVSIPRAQDGSVLINWPHTVFEKSFRHVSFYYLYAHDQLYSDLIQNLKARSTWGYLDQYKGNTSLTAQAEALGKLRDDLLSGDAPPEQIADYRAGRDSFLTEVGGYLASKPDDDLTAQLNAALGQKGLAAAQRDEYLTIQKDLPDWFAKTRGIYDSLMKIRTGAQGLGGLTGSISFIGNTNTGSTDLGVTPFQQNGYANLGTHASVINMLLARQFLSDVSPWWSWLLGLIGALALTFFLKEKKPAVSLSVGLVVSVVAVGVFAVIFVAFGLYIPVIPMASLIVLTFVGTTAYQFLNTEREKGFLRSAFSRYLSNDVIEQIIANPGQLKLGGQEKVLTALFTDIKGFSTISETMTPEELVHLLNQYLTGMSDIILDLQGTIDKYEGDAIISFFGAPVSFDDHAKRACLAAVRMKRLEGQLNIRFLEEKIAPAPLATRIGINTGPMVVGNMGTERMMNYTMIGDAVNLAARLEGVNKLYGTWILISEDTKNQIGDALVTRKLDRVRVVGKSIPIRLYEGVEEKGHLPQGVGRLLEVYDMALDHFEARRWTEAQKGFDECLKLFPEDGPSLRYRKLAVEYQKTPPPDQWDGVFKMETK